MQLPSDVVFDLHERMEERWNAIPSDIMDTIITILNRYKVNKKGAHFGIKLIELAENDFSRLSDFDNKLSRSLNSNQYIKQEIERLQNKYIIGRENGNGSKVALLAFKCCEAQQEDITLNHFIHLFVSQGTISEDLLTTSVAANMFFLTDGVKDYYLFHHIYNKSKTLDIDIPTTIGSGYLKKEFPRKSWQLMDYFKPKSILRGYR